jgi:SAM-dependent methyltransferase
MALDVIKQFLFDQHQRHVAAPRARRLHESLAAHVGRVDSLLDVGCGDGMIAKRLAEAAGAKRVVGVDVQLRPSCEIEVQGYDGRVLPFEDRSFDAVILVDVLHHCSEPLAVLREIMRVARRMVVIKDHFAFGPVSRQLLYWMDLVGNAQAEVFSPGTYFAPRDWVSMIDQAGGRIAGLDWPLAVHELPWRAVVRPELHFTAKIVPVS